MASKTVQVSEKEISATVSPSEEPLEANEAAEIIPARNLTRAIWAIVYGVALPCIPIIIISAILLYIIFHHQLKLNPGLPIFEQIESNAAHHNITTVISDYNKFKKQGGEWAYYVLYNPSTITTIASWTSRIIPYLQSSIMALVAFFAARHIVLKSKHGDESQLPNPEQLSLLIGTLGGTGFGPLKEVFLYRFTRNGRLIHPLPAAVSAFTIITIMALIIPVVDTWFGVATTAETVTQMAVNNSTLEYSKVISSNSCPNGPADNHTANSMLVNTTAFWPCNVVLAIDPNFPYITGLAEAGNIAAGVSSVTQIRNYTDPSNNTFWYMGSPAQNSIHDYQARTFATSSQCRPMTLEQCNIAYNTNNRSELRFQCTPEFAGNLEQGFLNASASESEELLTSYPNAAVAFSNNAALTEVTGQITSQGTTGSGRQPVTKPEMYTTNPLYYGVWTYGFPGPDISANGNFTGDAAFYWDSQYGGIWMLNCSTTVYDVSYTWVNGQVATFNTTPASTDFAALLTGPFVVGDSPYIQNALDNVALIAGAANSSSGIAKSFATEYSKTLLAYSIGAIDSVLVSAEQDRLVMNNVARVPLIPLYLLLATKAIYVLAVIILAIAAYAFTHPAETELVKDHLSVKGLASAHFNQPSVMHDNALKQLQSRLDARTNTDTPQEASSSSKEIEVSSPPVLRHAATAPPESPPKPTEAKVGLMPALDGTWQFVVKANGVWNHVKPVVKPLIKNVIIPDVQGGALGADAGNLVAAYTGK